MERDTIRGPTGHQFTLYHQYLLNWANAKGFCESVGGGLAVLNTKVLNDIVTQKFAGQQYWIGASDAEQEGWWRWINGDMLRKPGKRTKYNNWGQSEPNGGSRENCLFVDREKWADHSCGVLLHPLCEVQPKCSIHR